MDVHIFWKLCILLGVFVLLVDAQNNSFDVLVFSQQWPRTTCIQSGRRPNTCNVPRSDIWTIHGIWPSKSLQSGPSNCRRDLPFRVQELSSIRSRLLVQWINVLNRNPEGFWRHEWETHGTCSVNITDLNTQLKYFSKALEWNNRYNIESILRRGRITPGGNYTIASIQRTVNTGLRVEPQVTCVRDRTNKQYLHEVRFCADKNLRLVSCRGHLRSLTTCNRRSNVEYPRR